MQLFVLSYFESARDIPTWIVASAFFIPLAGGLIWYFYKTRHARLWRKGIYPPNIKFSQENLLEAYLALGSLLILADYDKVKGKTQFINQYFHRYFTEENYNFGDSLLFSLRHPIKIETVCDWLNAHLKEEGERAQVIYFLTGLAFLNETLTERELKFLQLMNDKLHLPKENLNRIISIFKSYKSTQNSKSGKQPKVKMDREKVYREILNVSSSASNEEIKKAYRKLVKLHHPDVFANASDAQKKLAEDKFIQIQEAYEHLVAK
jgi:DnaJ like chaperone protein